MSEDGHSTSVEIGHHPVVSRRLILILARCVELGLLVPAFGLVIPAVHSMPGDPYRLLPGLAYGATLYALSLVLAVRRSGENWLTASFKFILYLLLFWAVNERVSIGA
jgi:hypothetical protein